MKKSTTQYFCDLCKAETQGTSCILYGSLLKKEY